MSLGEPREPARQGNRWNLALRHFGSSEITREGRAVLLPWGFGARDNHGSCAGPRLSSPFVLCPTHCV